jgi:hypothetical protein
VNADEKAVEVEKAEYEKSVEASKIKNSKGKNNVDESELLGTLTRQREESSEGSDGVERGKAGKRPSRMNR